MLAAFVARVGRPGFVELFSAVGGQDGWMDAVCGSGVCAEFYEMKDQG